MNCDQVFDILTRGPFPTGTDCDPGVEAHLSHCVECRRLADALRPAIELFQESVTPEESRDLPGYWCAVAADRPGPMVSFARPPAPRPPLVASLGTDSQHWSSLAAWRMAAMLALGVTVGLMLSARGGMDGFSTVPPLSQNAAAGAPGPEIGSDLISVGQRPELADLPAACLRQPTDSSSHPLRGDRLLASADLSNLICCSECHNAGSDIVPASATLKVAQSCQACHHN